MKSRNEHVKQAVRIWLHAARSYAHAKSVQTAEFVKAQAVSARNTIDDFIVDHAVCTAKKMHRENIRAVGLIKDVNTIEPDEIITDDETDMRTLFQSLEEKMKGCCKF